MIPRPTILSLLVLLASDALSFARRRLTLTWAALVCAVESRREAEPPEPAPLMRCQGCDATSVGAPSDRCPRCHGMLASASRPVPPDDALPDGREPPWGAEPAPVHDPAALDAGELALFPEPLPMHAWNPGATGTVCGRPICPPGTRGPDFTSIHEQVTCPACVAAMAAPSRRPLPEALAAHGTAEEIAAWTKAENARLAAGRLS